MRGKNTKGNAVEAGEAHAEIETDKAIMDLEAFASGILRKILVQDGATVMSGTLIGVIGGADEDITSALTDQITAAPSVAVEQNKRAACCQRHPPSPTSPEETRVIASPRAKALAADRGIDLSTITGTGPGGRIVEEDVVKPRRRQREAAGRNRPTAEPDAESHRTSDDTEQSAGAAFLSDERDRYGAGRAVPRSVQTEPTTYPYIITDLLIKTAAITLTAIRTSMSHSPVKPSGGMRASISASPSASMTA